MIRDKRKSRRRTLHYTAWIRLSDGAPLRGCVVSDISDTGARLDVEHPEELPEAFQLLLSGRGGIHRQCQAVWRTSSQIGVYFEKAPATQLPRRRTALSARG